MLVETSAALTGSVLHPYQHRAVDFLLKHPVAAYWADPGLGKSLVSLTVIDHLYAHHQVERILVIAPKRVAHHTWPEEIQKWGFSGLTHTVITGHPAKRQCLLLDTSVVHIISRDLVHWLVDHFGDAWPYDMVVIDEASSFKSSKSRRFKSLKKVLPHIDRMVQLTGTPASNGLEGLWAQVYLLDGGTRLGKNITRFRSQYYNQGFMNWDWTLKPGAEDKIHAKVADLCLRMSAEDYLTLPDRVDTTVEVHLPTKVRDAYTEVEKEFVYVMESSEEMPVLSAAAVVNKLLQISNGAIYTEEGTEVLHDEKLDALDSIIEECAGAPVLVAYSYQSDLDRIRRRFRHTVDIREEGAIDAWNAGEIQLLAAHPASAGHGLNLQTGGNHIVWFGLPWSLELYQQFNARLHRQGQDKPVFVYHIQAVDTVDDQVRDALDRKDTDQKNLLNAVKAAASK